MAENAVKLVSNTDNLSFEEALRDLIKKPFDMTDAAYETMISSLLGYEEELNKLAQSAGENATALENSANLIARQELGQEADNAVVEMASEAYEKAYDTYYDAAMEKGKTGINAWSGKNNKQVQDFWEDYIFQHDQ